MPFTSHRETSASRPPVPARPLFALPLHLLHVPLLVKAHLSGTQGRQGGVTGGWTAASLTDTKLFYDESRRRCGGGGGGGGRPSLPQFPPPPLPPLHSTPPQPLLSCRSTSERCVRRRFPFPPVVRWRPAGAVIEDEWTAADGQEREGLMKRARRMALAPAGEQSAGSQD